MDPQAAAFDRWRAHGDLAALGAVFDALAPRLLPVALHLCGHAADAEDALQQTFLLAMDKASAFDRTQRLEPWLAGLLQNVVKNQSRRLKLRRGEALPELASDELGPLDRAEREELAARLRTHVDALPADQRQVLRLVLQHGMSAVSIAEVLEVPPGTVRMRMHRGLEALRRVLPASLAVLLTTAFASRGLAAVKAHVLEVGAAKAAAVAAAGAAGAAATGGSTIVLGGVLVTKKLVALLVLVGLASSLWWFGQSPDAAPVVEPTVPAAPVAMDAAGSRAPEPKVEVPVVEAPRVEVTPSGEKEPLPTEIWGVVLDAATKRPVPAARIELLRRDADAFWNLDLEYGARTDRLAQTTSDDEGRFRFDVARASPHRLFVEAAGFASRTALACTGGSVVTVELTRGSVLTGVVRSEGQPVPDADVRIAVRGESGALVSGVTDASGAFRFASLPPAEVYLQVSGEHFEEKWMHVTLAEGGQQHVEVDLPKGKLLRGRVLDKATGAPIAGARVSDSWTMRRVVRTDGDGRFQLDGLVEDSALMAHVQADRYTSATVQIGTKLDEELVVNLARGGEVRGRVVDADGNPLASAYVSVCASFEETPGMVGADWIPASVQANGTFVAAGLRSDQHYWLMARAPRFGMRVYVLPRVLEEGSSCDVGDVVLRPAGGIEGRVLDDQGKPMAHVEVGVQGHNADAFALRTDEGRVRSVHQFEMRSARTDAKGRYRFPDLAGGEWRLEMRPKGHDQPFTESVTLADGELRENLDFVVPIGLSISGRVLSADGKPFTDWVQLEAVGEGPLVYERASAKVASDGHYRFTGMKEGRYTLGLVVRPKGQVMAPFLHVAGGTEDLRIQLEVASYVGGKVLDDAGKPVRVNVYASFEDLPLGSTTTLTGEDGSFRLEVPASFRGSVQAMPIEGGISLFGGNNATEKGVTAGRTDLVLRWTTPTTGK